MEPVASKPIETDRIAAIDTESHVVVSFFVSQLSVSFSERSRTFHDGHLVIFTK